MRIAKKVLSQSSMWLMCCWDDCEKDGYELYKLDREGIRYVFCSERHRGYFAYSHRGYGQLPPGMKSSVC